MGLPDFDAWAARCDRLGESMDALTTELHSFPRNDQTHSRQYREWEPFLLVDGGNTDGSGNLTVGGAASNLMPAANGWEAFIYRVSVTVQGASSGASVANYVGGVSGQNLFDYGAGMLGNSPSRLVGEYTAGVYCSQARHVSIVVAGGAASSGVVVRVEGKRREV